MKIKKQENHMLTWAKELFPICRSLTGKGIQFSLRYFKKINPEFKLLKKASINAGALGFGISGSGPSVYALTKGKEIANKVSQAIVEVFSPIGIDFEIHISTINNQGIEIIPN